MLASVDYLMLSEQNDEAYIYDTSKRSKLIERFNPQILLGKSLISSVKGVGEKSPLGVYRFASLFDYFSNCIWTILDEVLKFKSPAFFSAGKTLMLAGQCELDLGNEQLRFIVRVADNFLHPMRTFLRQDLATAQKEKKELLNRRLELDSAKTRLKRTKSEKQFASVNCLAENLQST